MEVSEQPHMLATTLPPPQEKGPSIHCIGGWVATKARVEAVQETKICCPKKSSLSSSAVQPETVLTATWLEHHNTK
jgi:hypothetical protein